MVLDKKEDFLACSIATITYCLSILARPSRSAILWTYLVVASGFSGWRKRLGASERAISFGSKSWSLSGTSPSGNISWQKWKGQLSTFSAKDQQLISSNINIYTIDMAECHP
jgi:hypothetical protein